MHMYICTYVITNRAGQRNELILVMNFAMKQVQKLKDSILEIMRSFNVSIRTAPV